MKIILLYGGLTAALLFRGIPTTGQIFYPVTHLTGTQNINNVNVTVSYNLSSPDTITYCGAGPYWIGQSTPSSYTFSFFPAISNVRIQVTAMNSMEVISFDVNNTPYSLTATNLSAFSGTCSQTQATVLGGNLIAPGAPGYPGAGGELNISGSISSIKVMANGMEAGTVFNLAFQSVSLDVYSNAPLCQGDTLKLYADPATIGATYSWTGPGNFNSNLQNPVIPVAGIDNKGMYIVTKTTSIGTLTDSTFVDIMPLPETEITYDDPVCAGSDLHLSAQTQLSGVSFQWEGPNDFRDTAKNPVIQNVQPIHAGRYIVTATLGACSYTDEADLIVQQPVHFHFTEAICANEAYDFNGLALFEPGTYKDTLIAANGCDSIVTLDLTHLTYPQVTISLDQTTPLCMGDSVSLNAAGALSYAWYGNDHILDWQDAFARIRLPFLSNQIMVIGWAANGCRDSAMTVVSTQPCCSLLVPNAFSPNGDGLNDHFGVVSNGHFKHYHMSLYNRWGQRIFEGQSPENQWDGTINNAPAETGTYFYHISADCLDGSEIIRNGDLLLIR